MIRWAMLNIRPGGGNEHTSVIIWGTAGWKKSSDLGHARSSVQSRILKLIKGGLAEVEQKQVVVYSNVG